MNKIKYRKCPLILSDWIDSDIEAEADSVAFPPFSGF